MTIKLLRKLRVFHLVDLSMRDLYTYIGYIASLLLLLFLAEDSSFSQMALSLKKPLMMTKMKTMTMKLMIIRPLLLLPILAEDSSFSQMALSLKKP